jgi:PAS domain S-box-containing protein
MNEPLRSGPFTEPQARLASSFLLMAENCGDMLWSLDSIDGCFTFVNSSVEKILGLPRQGMSARRLKDILHSDNQESVMGILRDGLRPDCAGGEVPRVHIPLVQMTHSDGSAVSTEMTVTLNINPDGSGREILGVTRDITERLLREAQVRQSQKMEALGQLAGGVAQEFSNLLQAIQGFAQLASDLVEPGHDARGHLQEVLRASQRARSLAARLHAFGHRGDVPRISADLDGLLAGLSDSLRRTVGDSCELELTSDGGMKPVLVDPSDMEQALISLCTHARDAMPGGGTLRIATHVAHLDAEFCRLHPWARPGEFARLIVSDTGTGIPPDQLPRIFEPYFTATHRGRGTGMELAMVYSIVEQHGGFIQAESSPGDGTSFTIYLPFAPAPRRKTGEAVGEQQDVERADAETILLAEDDESVHAFTLQVLRAAGYRVLAARDGAEALKLFKEWGETVSLALLDIIMPKLNGMAVAHGIRSLRPGMPVLFSTGYDFRLLEDGFAPGRETEVIRKPFTHRELLKKIRTMIDEFSLARSTD